MTPHLCEPIIVSLRFRLQPSLNKSSSLRDLRSSGGRSLVAGVTPKGHIFSSAGLSLASAQSQIHPAVHSIIYCIAWLSLSSAREQLDRGQKAVAKIAKQKMLWLPEVRGWEGGKRQGTARLLLQHVSLQVWRQSRRAQGERTDRGMQVEPPAVVSWNPHGRRPALSSAAVQENNRSSSAVAEKYQRNIDAAEVNMSLSDSTSQTLVKNHHCSLVYVCVYVRVRESAVCESVHVIVNTKKNASFNFSQSNCWECRDCARKTWLVCGDEKKEEEEEEKPGEGAPLNSWTAEIRRKIWLELSGVVAANSLLTSDQFIM